MSGPYPYAGVIIIDPATNAPGPGASVLLYDPLDAAYATPEEITDAYGNSLGTTLTAGAGGWSGRFAHATLPILNAKPGEPGDLTQPSFELVSGAGIIENSAAAAESAAAAQFAAESAQAAAEDALAPSDAVVAGFITDPGSATQAAGLLAFGGGTGTDPDAIHTTGAESKAGILTLTDGLTIPTGGTLAIPDGGISAIIKVNGLTGALNAKADQSALDTTNGQIAQKVTGTPYNGFDMTFVPTGGSLPGDFGVGLILNEIP